MQKFSCKNKGFAFLIFLIIFPDPYSLSMQLLETWLSWNFHVSCFCVCVCVFFFFFFSENMNHLILYMLEIKLNKFLSNGINKLAVL